MDSGQAQLTKFSDVFSWENLMVWLSSLENRTKDRMNHEEVGLQNLNINSIIHEISILIISNQVKQ